MLSTWLPAFCLRLHLFIQESTDCHAESGLSDGGLLHSPGQHCWAPATCQTQCRFLKLAHIRKPLCQFVLCRSPRARPSRSMLQALLSMVKNPDFHTSVLRQLDPRSGWYSKKYSLTYLWYQAETLQRITQWALSLRRNEQESLLCGPCCVQVPWGCWGSLPLCVWSWLLSCRNSQVSKAGQEQCHHHSATLWAGGFQTSCLLHKTS